MEEILNFIYAYAYTAPWILFTLFLLSGLNLPISEDILLITAGVIASTSPPTETPYIFGWVYAGSIISAWETYWIGRYFGPKLYDIRLFRMVITPIRIKKLHHYYEKFGILTFMIIRFCPGGVRNALFLTSGLGKMPFPVFIYRDAIAAALSVSTIFSLGYFFGENKELILHYLRTYSHFVITLFAAILIIAGAVYWRKSHQTDSDI